MKEWDDRFATPIPDAELRKGDVIWYGLPDGSYRRARIQHLTPRRIYFPATTWYLDRGEVQYLSLRPVR